MSNSKKKPKRQKVATKEPIHAKKFACKFCEKSYTQSHSLKTHMRNVHEGKKQGKNYKCQLCKQAFTQSHSLRNHIQRVHKKWIAQLIIMNWISSDQIMFYIKNKSEPD